MTELAGFLFLWVILTLFKNFYRNKCCLFHSKTCQYQKYYGSSRFEVCGMKNKLKNNKRTCNSKDALE